MNIILFALLRAERRVVVDGKATVLFSFKRWRCVLGVVHCESITSEGKVNRLLDILTTYRLKIQNCVCLVSDGGDAGIVRLMCRRRPNRALPWENNLENAVNVESLEDPAHRLSNSIKHALMNGKDV
jgi:hypothetical protein